MTTRREAPEGKTDGDTEIHVAGGRPPERAHQAGRKELLQRLRAFRGRLPAGFKFDRDEANAR